MAGQKSYSIVEYYAEHERYKCGYCKSPDTNFSHGMWAYFLTVQDYQALIDRGWRRSGSYCYKPTMDQTCCPMYTIKCEALQFKISKSQKKTLKRMVKFLRNELKKDEMETVGEDEHDNLDANTGEVPYYKQYVVRAAKNIFNINVSSTDSDLKETTQNSSTDLQVNSNIMKSEQRTLKKAQAFVDECKDYQMSSAENTTSQSPSIDTTKPPCKKAKLLRMARKQNKLLAQGKSQKEIDTIFKESKQQTSAKSLEELFDEIHGGTNKLEMRLVRTSPMSSGYLQTSKISYEIYRKYQMMIHGVSAEKVTEQQYTRFLVKSPLKMRLVRVMSSEFVNTLNVSANLYKKYQMAIHGDDPEECDKKSFINFLVKSPLQHWEPADGPPQGYGSFHEQYWLNNDLIAVGVIDILPSCVSSVYFFYDPAYSHLSLGTFSSLREVYLTRQLNKYASNLKYYYMGFYIHTCPKMRYKARMKPSKLLCPESYVWCDIDSCLVKLDKQKYSRLNDDIDAIDENGIIDISKVLVLYKQVLMTYDIYKTRVHRENTEEDDEIKEYASLVGMKCAQRLLLYRS